MSNSAIFTQVFADALKIDPILIQDGLQYNSIREWDSIAHMSLVTALEDAFNIMLGTSDIIDMSSIAKAKEILVKHGVTF